MVSVQAASYMFMVSSISVYVCVLVTKVNLPIGETKNRVPYVKVCCY